MIKKMKEILNKISCICVTSLVYLLVGIVMLMVWYDRRRKEKEEKRKAKGSEK